MLTHTHKELTINMNEESKKLLDSFLFLQSVASIRGVKTEDRLIAFAEDMLAIRDGKEPNSTKGLI